MKFLASYKRLFIITFFSSVIMSPLLTSCGSSDTTTAGIGGTGITQGKITGFGSIFVNGVEFFTNRSQFEVDGDTALDEDALRIGMIVKITGSVSSDGLTGDAENVEYDDEIQGPIVSISAALDGQRTLTIFDKTVTIDESTTSFDDTDFADIKMNDIVEISGFSTSATTIDATFVDWKGNLANGDKEVEIKGTISDLDTTTKTFLLAGSVTINYTDQTEIEVPGDVLVDGLFVEVEGELQNATTILAEEIEAEDEDFEDGDEVSLQGVISNFNTILNPFTINGQAVDASNASLSPANTTLDDGVNVEVEGEIVNGVLIADEVELREGEVKIKAFVSSVDAANNRFEFGFSPLMGSIVINTDNQTSFEDEVMSTPNFSINDLMIGYFVKIEGIDNGSQVIASQVKRLDPTGEDTEVQGSVEEFVNLDHVTILGIEFRVDASTVLTPIAPITGDIVEMTDDALADGTADEIEIEN